MGASESTPSQPPAAPILPNGNSDLGSHAPPHTKHVKFEGKLLMVSPLHPTPSPIFPQMFSVRSPYLSAKCRGLESRSPTRVTLVGTPSVMLF